MNGRAVAAGSPYSLAFPSGNSWVAVSIIGTQERQFTELHLRNTKLSYFKIDKNLSNLKYDMLAEILIFTFLFCGASNLFDHSVGKLEQRFNEVTSEVTIRAGDTSTERTVHIDDTQEQIEAAKSAFFSHSVYSCSVASGSFCL
ncbi:hypothetical protein ACJX0J_035701, partial [Zea mays]